MKKEHRALLEKCQPQLIQAIVSNRCLEDLICNLASQAKNGNDGLTPSDIKKIRKERHTCEDDKVKMFLDTLCKKIEVAYNRFIKVMIDTNQTRLISILNSELPPDQQIGNESSALTASTSSTSASSRKRRIPLDDNQEGSSGISDPKTIDSEKAMPAELKMPSTSSSSTYETHTAYSQDCRDNKGNQMNGGNFEGAVFNQQIYHYAPPSSQAPSTSSTTTSQPSAEDWRKKLKTYVLRPLN
uniref:CARD domain-containing protein n=1 Tax=Plectus sambesii TaxID=2011161 RepID=A0A914VZC9_9BILA